MSARTKYDLTISSGLALLAATKRVKEEKKKDFTEVEFLRRFKNKSMHL
jgi:predicted hydrolase (HD superfamily)